MQEERLKIIMGDITTQKVDALVNAANNTLLGGGGVDGAIHRAAGPELLTACKNLFGCRTGEAKITEGFNLPAQFIIHTVGPVWKDGRQKEDELLANCYRNSLRLASENRIRTLAFPCIATGVYNYPKERAAKIALLEIRYFLKKNVLPVEVTIVCFSEEDYQIYNKMAGYK